jgi:hypothetical protein
MGVKNGADTLYHLVNLTRADIAAIARGRHSAMQDANNPDFDMEMPTVDCDTHNVCHVIASKRIAETKSSAVAQFYLEWSLYGIVIASFVHGDERPRCKQASNEKIAAREMNRIEGHIGLKEASK